MAVALGPYAAGGARPHPHAMGRGAVASSAGLTDVKVGLWGPGFREPDLGFTDGSLQARWGASYRLVGRIATAQGGRE